MVKGLKILPSSSLFYLPHPAMNLCSRKRQSRIYRRRTYLSAEQSIAHRTMTYTIQNQQEKNALGSISRKPPQVIIDSITYNGAVMRFEQYRLRLRYLSHRHSYAAETLRAKVGIRYHLSGPINDTASSLPTRRSSSKLTRYGCPCRLPMRPISGIR
jgi:hypothetical protein